MNKLATCIDFLKQHGIRSADVAVILGTGLSRFPDHLKIEKSIPYSDIPHFPNATVEFHKGRLLLCREGELRVLVMQGRFHFYEGYDMQQIAFPIGVMKMLGVKYLLISNAAGSINPNFKKGSLMMLENHINLLPIESFPNEINNNIFTGNRNSSFYYNAFLKKSLMSISEKHKITLHSGVYAAVSGPNLETRAEYRYLKIIGSDAVGMSTVPEVLAAHRFGIPTTVVSVLTDECDPDNLSPVDISEIIKVAAEAEPTLVKLFHSLILEIKDTFEIKND